MAFALRPAPAHVRSPFSFSCACCIVRHWLWLFAQSESEITCITFILSGNTGFAGSACSTCAAGYKLVGTTCVACTNFCCNVPSLSSAVSASSRPAAGGTQIVISAPAGTSLCAVTAVSIGAFSCASVVKGTSGSTVTCTSPAGTGASLPIQLVSWNGNVVLTATWSYNAPIVTAVSPATFLSTLAGATTLVNITGSNFGSNAAAVSVVLFSGSHQTGLIPIVFISDSRITISAPSLAGVPNVLVNVSAQSSCTRTGASACTFTVAYAPPTISGIIPATGLAVGGYLLTIQVCWMSLFSEKNVGFSAGEFKSYRNFPASCVTFLTGRVCRHQRQPRAELGHAVSHLHVWLESHENDAPV